MLLLLFAVSYYGDDNGDNKCEMNDVLLRRFKSHCTSDMFVGRHERKWADLYDFGASVAANYEP